MKMPATKYGQFMMIFALPVRLALLEAGEISIGRAGKILGVSRLEVIEMMKKWDISLFDDSQDLEELRQEVEQAELILNQQIS